MLAGGTILLLAVKSAMAASDENGNQAPPNEQRDDYRCNELSLDAFGTASLGKYSIGCSDLDIS